MAVKSGVSHTLAAIIATIVGAIFIEYLKIWTPGIFNLLNKLGIAASHWLYKYVGVTIPQQVFVPLFVTSLLAFVWGVLYHMARFGK